MPEPERSEVFEFCGGDVVLWAEPGEPIMLRSIDTSVAGKPIPVELTADEARDLARRLLQLADWVDAA